jgi:hypothetical protein
MNRRRFIKACASLLQLPYFVPAGSLWLPPERPLVEVAKLFTTIDGDVIRVEYNDESKECEAFVIRDDEVVARIQGNYVLPERERFSRQFDSEGYICSLETDPMMSAAELRIFPGDYFPET